MSADYCDCDTVLRREIRAFVEQLEDYAMRDRMAGSVDFEFSEKWKASAAAREFAAARLRHILGDQP